MKKRQGEIELAESDIEELPQDPLEEEAEEVPSLEELVKRSETEIKGAVREIEQRGEARVEKVAENIGVSSKQIEKTKEEIGFRRRRVPIMKRIQDLYEETREKIRRLFDKKEEGAEIKEPFDQAEEYKKIQEIVESDASLKEKQKAVKEYKKELMRQKEGIARLQDNLRKNIEKNPEISAEEMMQLVDFNARELRLTEKHKEFFKDFAEAYREKHQAIKNAREEYPDGKELFKACFGFEPRGGIKVIQGPMSFYFRCSNPEDFADIYVQDRKNLGGVVSETERNFVVSSGRVGAQVPHTSIIPELKNLLIIENSKFVEEGAEKGLLEHEEQHIVKRFFKEKSLRSNLREEIKMLKSVEEREKILLPYLRYLREKFMAEPAKDEVLAFYKQNLSPKDIYYIMVASREQEGLYDFLALYESVFSEDLKELGINQEMGEKAIEKVFKQEYWEILRKTCTVLGDLEKMGKSRDEIVELLIKEPLEQWSNVVRHIKQVKRGR